MPEKSVFDMQRELLSEQELAAVHYAQTKNIARAKMLSAELAEALGVDEQTKARLIGAVGIKLANMSFLEREAVSNRILELTLALGGQAINGANGNGSVYADTIETLRVVHTDDKLIEVVFPEESQEAADSARERIDSRTPLSSPQKRWLSNILPESEIERIDGLFDSQKMTFINNLTRAYVNLRINRLGTDAKQTRAEQLAAFMGGKTNAEIAKMYDSNPSAIWIGLNTMSKSISQRIPADKIATMIPSGSDSIFFEEPAEEPEKTNELTRVQISWYKKLLGSDYPVESLRDLDEYQQAHLAELLARRLRAYFIRRDGRVKTDRRVGEIEMLIKGSSLEEIAEAISVSPEIVKKELHSSALSLHRRTNPRDLDKIIEEAKAKTNEGDEN